MLYVCRVTIIDATKHCTKIEPLAEMFVCRATVIGATKFRIKESNSGSGRFVLTRFWDLSNSKERPGVTFSSWPKVYEIRRRLAWEAVDVGGSLWLRASDQPGQVISEVVSLLRG